jgi:hypothetical protein
MRHGLMWCWARARPNPSWSSARAHHGPTQCWARTRHGLMRGWACTCPGPTWSWVWGKHNLILGYDFHVMAFKWGRCLENHDPS